MPGRDLFPAGHEAVNPEAVMDRSLAAFTGALMDVVFPENALCLCCGTVTQGAPVCESCFRELTGGGTPFVWRYTEPDGVPVWSLRAHRGAARALVHRLKYGADACAARVLTECLPPVPAGFVLAPGTVVTWVPMPGIRRLERCIDHGRALAETFAGFFRLPVRQLLARGGGRAHTQEGLDRDKRVRNLDNAYTALGRVDTPVLLVDDVFTTGTTAKRCVTALREAGAENVTVLTATKA